MVLALLPLDKELFALNRRLHYGTSQPGSGERTLITGLVLFLMPHY